MDELEELILDLGNVVKKLRYPFDEGVTFPLEGRSLINAEELVNKTAHDIDSTDFHEIEKRLKESKTDFSDIKISDPCLSVAGRMLGHDLKNHWFVLKLTPEYIERSSRENRKDPEVLSSILYSLIQVKLFCGVINYLASRGKDSSLLLNVPANQMGFLLRGALGCDIIDDIDLKTVSTIRSDGYVCITELLKNAIAYGVYDKLSELKLKIVHEKNESDNLYQVISIHDNGKGIIDDNGKQLSPTVIREIYREYSTSNSGMGGRTIGCLIDIANANLGEEKIKDFRYNINVITKSLDSDYLYFNRDADVCEKGADKIRNLKLSTIYFAPDLPLFDEGTVFRLFMPINKDGSPL